MSTGTPPPPSTIIVIVQAFTKFEAEDGGEGFQWNMGDDLRIEVSPTLAFRDFALKVKEIKGIPLIRMRFQLRSGEIKESKWERTLRQVGIYDKGKVRLEPTTPFCWQWEPIEYYWQKTVEALVENCDPKLGCSFAHLKEKVPLPPTMKSVKLVSFIRKYPDIFQIEVNTSSTDTMWVHINKDYDLPTWV
ncbi:hypothetical protein TrRE_jg10616 [Triparma retinervis]|uniref:Uncharacterized protein n=1 Tax=Triparma retinervis TaxID=2557542 RepID=A0A9W7DL13_9STRA|nr:hypothetical protein TrRE_jg10616 [Triparma retinervis]